MTTLIPFEIYKLMNKLFNKIGFTLVSKDFADRAIADIKSEVKENIAMLDEVFELQNEIDDLNELIYAKDEKLEIYKRNAKAVNTDEDMLCGDMD